MKGRTSCPKCKHEFVLDLPGDGKKHKITCPNCKHNFTITTKSTDESKSEECSWEEHGEPRKTILSSFKPKTIKPKIAAVLLIAVFLIGIVTAGFSENYIESSLDASSAMGFRAKMKISIINETNSTLSNVTISLDGINGKTNSNGSYFIGKIKPGLYNLEILSEGYKLQRHEIVIMPFLEFNEKFVLKEGSGISEDNKYNTIGCMIIIIIFSVFALLAAISCIKRRHLDVGLAGSFLGIFSFGFFLTGSILSLIAFIIIMLSRDEFENGKKGKIF